MRILDLGCGKAASSIFLAREFGVTVWATDLWFNPSENWQRICDAGCASSVFPIHADARSLPFANQFFDAIISIDAFPYFGTDFHYLSYLARFVKPAGAIAICCAGFTDELSHEQLAGGNANGKVAAELKEWIRAEPALLSMHSASWWRQHWQQSGAVDVEIAESMPDGWQLWLEWLNTIAPDNQLEINAIRQDAGQFLTYNRIVSHRRIGVELADPITSIPSSYTKVPMLNEGCASV